MAKRILSLALVLILVFGLAACGQSRPTDPPEAGGTAPALPITLPTEAPETEAAGYVRPAGADSVKTLLEKSMDFIRSDCVAVEFDNDHSENPEDWITPAKVKARLLTSGRKKMPRT